MQTASIVIVSLFIGAFFVVILGGLATLIILHVRLKRAMSEISTEFRQSVEKMESAAVKLSADVETSIAGARTSFSGIRTDMKTILVDQGNQIADVLARHDKAFEDKLGKINGAALEAACIKAVEASKKIVEVSQFMQRMITDSEPATQTTLAPEQYGPEDTVYARQSRTSAVDDALAEIEAADATSVHATEQ